MNNSELYVEAVLPHSMNITITQSAESPIVIRDNLETNAGIRKRGAEITAPDIDDLAVLLNAEKLDPNDMMFYGIRVSDFLAHRHANDVDPLLASLFDFDDGDMFFLTLGFGAFKNVTKLHVFSFLDILSISPKKGD